jgi:beta-mannosidase
MRCWLSVVGCSLFVAIVQGQEVHIPLNEGWSFRQVGTEQWYPAQVPGVVQQDLLRNGLIPDPMHNANADSVQWIELKDWEYRRTLVADEAMLKHGHLDLVFKGLDTFAEVYLNDSLLGKADNMFRSWEWPVKAIVQPRGWDWPETGMPFLKPGANEVKVIFRSPIVEGAKLREAYGIQLPHDSDPSGVSPYIRKAAYQFGWDFAPRLVTCGIWQEVELRGWSVGRIKGIKVDLLPLTYDESHSTVQLGAQGYLVMPENTHSWLNFRIGGIDGGRAINHSNGPGDWHQREIPNIGLWQPAGSGSPNLYQLQAEQEIDHTPLDHWDALVGAREIWLDQKKDSVGKAFRFKVNDRPIFMKGCNLVPPTSTPSAQDDSLWVAKVKDMQRTGMNMVRVWAGGIYPPDAFFHGCDTAGILVWQDLMFGYSPPGDKENLKRNEREVWEQVGRLRNHASLALFCGNNELEVAWNNWGWQQTYKLDKSQDRRIGKEYHRMFDHRFKEIAEWGGLYTPTSPLSNWGNAEGLKNGDLHYWGVWHGDSAFSSFRNNVGRFVSEYGFQSYPDSATLATQLDPEHLFLGSPMLAARQKSYKTDKPIWTAIDREFAVKPRYLGEFILFSQLAQAEAYRQAIWAHVTNQPHCMGTLFWQLNDVWAGPSWSTVDHTGTWKAAMYEVTRSYKPVVLDLELANGKVTGTLWNERTDLKAAKVVTQVFRTDGQRISSDTVAIALSTGKSVVLSAGQEDLLKGGADDRHVVRVAMLDALGEVLAARILPFKRMGEMAWEKAEVRLERVGGTEASVTYRVSTDRPVPLVKLEASGAEFSDNYFPLLPDTDRTVTVTWPGGMTGKVGLRSWP